MPKQTTIEAEHHEPEQGGVATAEDPAPAPSPGAGADDRRQLDARLKLKNVNFQKGTASIGFEADRGEVSLPQAAYFFCNARLQVTIRIDEDQETLPGLAPEPLNNVVDIKRFGTDVEKITGSMAFSIDDVEPSALLAVRSKHIKLTAQRIGSAESDDEGGGEDDGHEPDPHTGDLFDADDDDAAATQAPAGRDAWKSVKIDVLKSHGVTAKQIEILHRNGVKTLGKFGELGTKHGTFWHSDIKGIGVEVGGKIQDAFNVFLMANPHLTADAPATPPDGSLLTWQEGKGSHLAHAYSSLKGEGDDTGYGYWIDQAGDKFVLSGEREVVAEESEHDTLDDAKAEAERLERQHIEQAEDEASRPEETTHSDADAA